ncbi:hypothetical protein CASFOL_042373 [Castilleja foliolosa]|uniref:Kinesin motor domain-containing protein n=1 Tax=Castilleja foliolosa TaxID=1961234 RepID=A0ABD3BAX8_9LAMI
MFISSHSELSKHAVNSKLMCLKDKVEDFNPLANFLGVNECGLIKLKRLVWFVGIIVQLGRYFKNSLALVREDYLQLRQEAIDLQVYSSAKLDRVTRYLGVLANKTRKLEGSCHDHGLYGRSFEELLDFSNSDATSASRYRFSVSVFELYNEQITDLLLGYGNAISKFRIGSLDYPVEPVQEKVENPIEFSKQHFVLEERMP